jgi:hypothetical protein
MDSSDTQSAHTLTDERMAILVVVTPEEFGVRLTQNPYEPRGGHPFSGPHAGGLRELGSKPRVLLRIAVAKRSGVTELGFLSQ